MGEIKLLHKNVSNKIAAGEVVERPLSVVKELVENAIDAGAGAVSISITGGGINEICVTDNGSGIKTDDVCLAFEKHATSKIFSEKDLSNITTQGFRGEALSSIAAVSVVDMKTKTKDEDMGMHARISGGRRDYIEPAGLPDGTSVMVSNLFFNVPARLKFLKKPPQEAAIITDLISRYILAFPEISFHYTSQGKTIYHSPGNNDLREAIYCVYGAEIMENIVYVQHEVNGIKVNGYVTRPGILMKNRRAGSVFVNRRYVRSTMLHDMVKSAYGETLVKGEFPFFALNIVLPFSDVDVNVHPNKLSVRFRDSAAVEYVIKEAVSAACRKTHGSVDMNFKKQNAPKKAAVEMQSADTLQTEFFSGFSRAAFKEDTGIMPPQNVNSYETEDTKIPSAEPNEEKTPAGEYAPKEEQDYTENPILGYKLIGNFHKTYVLVEQGENLLLIDQHAAHERLLYNKFKSSPEYASQPLLSPHVMSVSHEQKNLIDENIEIFNELGFDIQPFGALEYKINAVPSIAYNVSVNNLLIEALDEISGNSGDVVLSRENIIRASCRSAVKAGDTLSDTELQSIVDSFLSTDIIPTCPHGRPVISVITKKQIEKSFKRIV